MYHIKNEHNIEVQNYYNIYCKKSQHQGYCKICGKKTNFISITKGYRIVCSKQCKKLKLTKDRKIVMNHKYGTDNIHLIPQIQEKITNTFIKNYGVDNPLKSPQIRKKLKQTNKKKYGCESPLGNKEIHKKILKTSIEKYGGIGYQVEQLRQRGLKNTKISKKQIWEKIKNTSVKKYGGIGFASQQLKEKQINTMIKKYGVRHNSYLRNNAFQYNHFKQYITKFKNVIHYQSKLQLLFITKCEAKNKRILDGDTIPYQLDGKQHLYYSDFKVLEEENKWRLYQIKAKHPWFYQELNTGILKAKILAAQQYSKKMGYLKFKLLFEGNINDL